MFNFPYTEKLYSLLIKLDISINFNYSRFIRCIFISSLFFSCRKKRRSKQLMGLFVIRFFYKILKYSNEKREFRGNRQVQNANPSLSKLFCSQYKWTKVYFFQRVWKIQQWLHYSNLLFETQWYEKLQKQSNYNSTLQQANLYKS